MTQPHTYVPFAFEGELTPQGSQLGHTISTMPEKRGWLIRAAVSDESLTDNLLNQSREWIQSEDPSLSVVAIFVAEQLGLNSLTAVIAERLLAADDAWLSYQVPVSWADGGAARLRFDRVAADRSAGALVGYRLAWLMADFVLRSCVPGERASQAVKVFAAQRVGLQSLAWRVLEPQDFEGALQWVPDFLAHSPQYANEVATRYALLAKDICPELAGRCGALPAQARGDLAEALEKNLRRIGRIKLWVECRQALRQVGGVGEST